ncbi:MAG TPA: acyl-CoA thioesterase [Gammaproteobacteria bacterium]|nr:acyl-CoA thioesterase [Gammaproteobacteria bacterium]
MTQERETGATYIRELPADAKLLHRAEYVMRWGDMDAFGHLNNAVYFTYFEQARVDWLHSLNAGHTLVLANISCTFLKALKYPARLLVRLYAGTPGRSSLPTYYALCDSRAPDELCALAHGTIVWFDHAAGHSVEIPEVVRKCLSNSG